MATIESPIPRAPDGDPAAPLADLLRELDDSHGRRTQAPPLPFTPAEQNQLLQVRLGVASSLFHALRWKHEPTAQHSLRVGLGCAAWARHLALAQPERDALELAGLLHDIGKVGVPEQLLTKPSSLSPQESAVMDGHWMIGLDILKSSCAVPAVLECIAYSHAWYDGSKGDYDRSGQDLPKLARMLMIVDAYDAMVTDHVYRRALSRERAMHELYLYSGSQFDPALVKCFNELDAGDYLKLQETVARGWLQPLGDNSGNSNWRLSLSTSQGQRTDLDAMFQRSLLDQMQDAVMLLDSSLRIKVWSRGAEKLTGISASSLMHRRWLPSLVRLRDPRGMPIADDQCPFAATLGSGQNWSDRFMIRGRAERDFVIQAQAMPVASRDGIVQGVTVVMHDLSPEVSLEERCQRLHERATQDPLTKIANRAEFDRVHDQFVAVHKESNLLCSLMICDIDRFKLVNDTYGHQAGDQVICSFAALLKSRSRPGDLVARYGGEEFVMLWADCDLGAAAKRAEELREAYAAISQPALNGRTVSASFGVTAMQPGDIPETMLRRADRALLMAKEQGRNRVVQLGTAVEAVADGGKVQWTTGRRESADLAIEQALVSDVPVAVTIEKLKGFVADHCAEVIALDDNQVELRFVEESQPRRRRATERPPGIFMRLTVREDKLAPAEPDAEVQRRRFTRTRIDVCVWPEDGGDRPDPELKNRSKQLLTSLRAYLMAELVPAPAEIGVLDRAKQLLAPWLAK